LTIAAFVTLLDAGASLIYGQHRNNTRPDNRATVIKYKRVVRPHQYSYK
jgi:hypothetical protein